MEQRQIDRTAGRCVRTGRQFEEGEEYYAVLFEDGDVFRREDYSLDAWKDPPKNAYCFFKTKMPIKAERKRLLVDDHLLFSFFQRLADETEMARLQFRFVLALILMRKRLLKYDETVHDGDSESWRLRCTKDQSSHLVLNPQLTDDQIEGVSKQLSAILHADARGAWDVEEDIESTGEVDSARATEENQTSDAENSP